MSLFTHILEIAILGLIGGAVPGPMLTAAFTEVLNGGLKKGMRVVFKALIAESFFALLILVILFAFKIPPMYFYVISFGGAIVLFWLAEQVWGIEKIGGNKGEVFSFPKIFLLTFLSGALWIFWITICVPRAFALQQIIAGGQYVFLAVFELGWLFMTSLLVFIFSRFRPLLIRKKLVSTVFKIFALILVFFAVKSIWGSVVYFLQS